MYFLAILLVFVAGWGISQYAILYPEVEWSNDFLFLAQHVASALALAYYQMFGEMYTDNVIRSPPFDMPDNDEWCTNDPLLYRNYTQLRCPDKKTNWLVFAFLTVFMILTNLMLFNLLVAIFNYAFNKIQGMFATDSFYHRHRLEWGNGVGEHHRVGEQRERSLPEIGKMYRKYNKFIDRYWKMYLFSHMKSK